MDATAQLALMTKLKIIFEKDDIFLSFPVTMAGLSYTPEQLTFVPMVQDMPHFLEFSELTNALPTGALFQPSLDDSSLLGSEYLKILKSAQLAQGALTAQQNTDLQQARAFLYAQDPDGLPTPSASVIAYQQYQQAWFKATQNYKAAQTTAQMSTDPQVQAQWQNTDEPQLRAQVDAAQNDWVIKGFKAQVEQAMQVEQRCAAQSPSLVFSDWLSQCNADLASFTDPSTNQSFLPTIFSPHDVLEQAVWPNLSITGAEIPNLVSQAPAELTKVVGTTSGSSIVDSVTFEYCSVSLTRTWFRPDVFWSQFWRFPDSATQLSDGNVPAQGEWPAYITAVIFARNVAVTMHNNAQAATQPMHPILMHPIFMIATQVTPAAQPAPVPHPAPALFPHPMVMMAHPAAQPAPAPHAAPAPPLAHPTVMMAHPAAQPAPAPHAAPAPPLAHATVMAINPAAFARLNASTFASVPATAQPASAAPGPGAAPAGASQQPPPGPAQVTILAFICKRLPKCPNPDPTLDWG